MSKKWLVILFLLVIVTVGFLVFWFWNNPKTQVKILKRIAPNLLTSGETPLELSEDFDPTSNPSTFMFLGKLDNERIKINRVFPPVVGNEEFESLLVCEKGIKVKAQNDKKSQSIDMSKLLPLFVLENEPILITGMCESLTCETITGECDVFLSGKSKL